MNFLPSRKRQTLSILINIFKSEGQRSRFLNLILKSNLLYTVQFSRFLSFITPTKVRDENLHIFQHILKSILYFRNLEIIFVIDFLKFTGFKMLARYFSLEKSRK